MVIVRHKTKRRKRMSFLGRTTFALWEIYFSHIEIFVQEGLFFRPFVELELLGGNIWWLILT